MKEKLLCCIRSIAVLLALSMLFSLAFAALYYFNLISTKTFHIINWAAGILAFASGGVVLGLQCEKKALLNAFVLIAILAVCMLLISKFSFINIIEILSKLFAYVIACMLIYTKKHKA